MRQDSRLGDEMGTVPDFSQPHVLRNEAEYEAAIREVERLLDEDPARGSASYDRLEFLSLLVEDYEERAYPMDSVSPQEAVAFMLEQRGMARSDLNNLMGGSSRVSEFFSGKRELSKSQVQALRFHLGIRRTFFSDRVTIPGEVDRGTAPWAGQANSLAGPKLKRQG